MRLSLAVSAITMSLALGCKSPTPTPTPTDDDDVACRVNALSPDERVAQEAATQRIVPAMTAARAAPAGYLFQLPATPAMIADTAQWVAREQRCCPFLAYAIRFGARGGELWVEATGGTAAREFLAETLLAELAKRHVTVSPILPAVAR